MFFKERKERYDGPKVHPATRALLLEILHAEEHEEPNVKASARDPHHVKRLKEMSMIFEKDGALLLTYNGRPAAREFIQRDMRRIKQAGPELAFLLASIHAALVQVDWERRVMDDDDEPMPELDLPALIKRLYAILPSDV